MIWKYCCFKFFPLIHAEKVTDYRGSYLICKISGKFFELIKVLQ